MPLMIINTALLCMAMNIYKEARGEPIPGQYAVGFVTMRRADEDPKRVCQVIAEKNQFSWTKKAKVVKQSSKVKILVERPKDIDAWDKAKKIAKVVLTHRISNFVGPISHYHSVSVHPRWRYALTPVRVIGSHIFYREGKSVMRKA